MEIYRPAIFQAQECFDDCLFFVRNYTQQIFLKLNVFARLLESDSLYNEGGGFIQSVQNFITLFVKHIMYTAVVDVASTDLDRSVHGTFVNNRQHFFKASLYWCGIVAKLK